MFKRLIAGVLCLSALTMAMSSCAFGNNTYLGNYMKLDMLKQVESIRVVENPLEIVEPNTPDEYVDLMLKSLKVMVRYTDESTEYVGYSDVTISPIDTSKPGDQMVTVAYKGVTTTFYVFVGIPIEGIEITNAGQKYSESHGDYVIVRPNEQGERKFQIEYAVYPENAVPVSVNFFVEQSGVATVNKNGLVTFSGPGMIKVTVYAGDEIDVQDTILIISP